MLTLAFVLLLQFGCAYSSDMIEHYGVAFENFYPTGPIIKEKSRLYVQGITQRAGENIKYSEHPSYLVYDIATNSISLSEWIDPGTLSKSMPSGETIPYQQGDFCSPTNASAKLCGRVLIMRDFQNPEKYTQINCTSYRDPRRLGIYYPSFCILLPLAVVLDIATSPIQLVELYIGNQMFDWN